MRTIWKVGIGFLVLGAIGSAFKSPPKEPTPEERAIDARRAREATAVAFAKSTIPKQMRDPASAVFGKIDAHTDRKLKGLPVTVVCGSVNSKNAFGGYTGMREFVMIAETGALIFNNDGDNSKFVDLWNSLCAGKHS